MPKLNLLKVLKDEDGTPRGKVFQDPVTKAKQVQILNCRQSFMFVGTPGDEESNDDDGAAGTSFRTVVMMSKATHKVVYDELKKINAELEKEHNNGAKIAGDKTYLSDGDNEEKYPEEKYKTFRGHWLVNAKDKKTRPFAYNQKGELMNNGGDKAIDKMDEEFYSGCWAIVMVRPWFFGGTVKGKSKTFPKRISNGFMSCQKVRNDTPFGNSRIDDSDAYGAIEGADGINDGDDEDEL